MTQAFEVVQPSNSTTLIEFILDETGSMGTARKATIDSFNEYINSQRSQPGDCYLSLTKFDKRGTNYGGAMIMAACALPTTVMPEDAKVDLTEDVRTMYTDVPIDKVEYLSEATYAPSGMTNLYDAVGARINALTARSAQYAGCAKLIVIMTDGHDNASREFTAESLKTLINQKEAEGWTFVFLGANQDAWQVGQAFGMSKGNTMTYSTGDMHGALETLSVATTAYRGMVASGAVNAEMSYKGFFDPNANQEVKTGNAK